MQLKPYTVILVSYALKETRVYEVYASNPASALLHANSQDAKDYPERKWISDFEENSFEVMEGHNLTKKRG